MRRYRSLTVAARIIAIILRHYVSSIRVTRSGTSPDYGSVALAERVCTRPDGRITIAVTSTAYSTP